MTARWGRKAAGVLFLCSTTGRAGLTLRSEFVNEPFTYGLVGGAVDPGEDTRKAVSREAYEEIGCRLDPRKLVELHVHREPGFQYTTYLCVTKQEFRVPPERLNWETDAFEWLDLANLPANIHPDVAVLLSDPEGLICRARVRD